MTTITLLTTADCHLCDDAKQRLARLAPELDFMIAIYDVNSDEGRPLAARAAMPFPPVVLINDTPFSFGRLSEGRLRRELQRMAAADRQGGSTT